MPLKLAIYFGGILVISYIYAKFYFILFLQSSATELLPRQQWHVPVYLLGREGVLNSFAEHICLTPQGTLVIVCSWDARLDRFKQKNK